MKNENDRAVEIGLDSRARQNVATIHIHKHMSTHETKKNDASKQNTKQNKANQNPGKEMRGKAQG